MVSALEPWVKRLPPAMRLPFDDWKINKVFDMRTFSAAFFLGSGCINDRLVKMRRLVFGRVFTCCRSRLVAYLVPRAPARQRICALAASAASEERNGKGVGRDPKISRIDPPLRILEPTLDRSPKIKVIKFEQNSSSCICTCKKYLCRHEELDLKLSNHKCNKF